MSPALTVDDDDGLHQILADARTIAVVGASTDPTRDSNVISRYLIRAGYEAVPVNPKYTEVLGRKCFPTVTSIGRQIDIVDVFRRSDFVEDTAKDAIEANAQVLWMQLGVENEKAARLAADEGILVVMNRCIMVEHRRLIK